MADEILKRDQNTVTVLAGIENDADGFITMLRVDPITKRLLVAANLSGVAVTSFNGLVGAVTISAGTNIQFTTVGNNIQITALNDTTAVWGSITGTITDQTDLVNNFLYKPGKTGGQTAIGGTAITDILKLQGTTGNGTATSPAIQFLVGNNGARVAGTISNDGNWGLGVSPVPQTSLKIDRTFTATNLIATSNVFGVARMNWNTQVSTDAYSIWGCTIIGDANDTSSTTGEHIGVGGEVLFNGRATQALSKAVQGRIFVGYPSQGAANNVLTAGAALYAQSPSVDSANGSKLTNAYGLYINAQSGTNITNSYGVYSSGASDINYFAGKVGIGINAPSTLLHVGTFNTSSTKIRTEGVDNTANSNTTFWNVSYVGHTIYNRSNTTNAVSAILFAEGASANANAGIAGVQEVSDSLGALAFYTGGAGLSNTVPERVRITSGGNVGIGTTSPAAPLEIKSDTSPMVQITAPTGNPALTFSNIGYTLKTTLTQGSSFKISDSQSGGDIFASTPQGAALTLGNSSYTTKTVIYGSLGIGTSSPTNKFSMTGQAAQTWWLERNTTANTAGNTLTIQSGGATVAATDKNGGMFILSPGLSTGTGFASIRLQSLSRAASTATADNSLQDRIIIPSQANLTNNSATNLFEVATGTDTASGGTIDFSVNVVDTTNHKVQSYVGKVKYEAHNENGVIAGTITEEASPVVYLSGGTLTTTWAITAGTGKMTISLNANSSLAAIATEKLEYTINNLSRSGITQL